MSAVENSAVANLVKEIDSHIHSIVYKGVDACKRQWVELTVKFDKTNSKASSWVATNVNEKLYNPTHALIKIAPLALAALVLSSPLGTTWGFLKLTGITLTAAGLSSGFEPSENQTRFRAVSLAAGLNTVISYFADAGLITTLASALLSVGSYYASKGEYVAPPASPSKRARAPDTERLEESSGEELVVEREKGGDGRGAQITTTYVPEGVAYRSPTDGKR